jgi:succinyl-diaminopimelate desuccinylase
LRADFLVPVLESLVRTESVNPGTPETAMAKVVSTWLEQTYAEVDVVEFAPGRASVAAVLRGRGDGPTLVLNGHMDTVPVDDESLWTTDPFAAEVRDGYVYGRGACDMKGGLAVQIGVARYLGAVPRDRLRGSLVMHFAAGEERGEPGTRSLLDAGFTGDYGITTEPTRLRVATATRGVASYRLRIHGRSIHASKAELGRNPLWPLRQILDAIEEYDREVRGLEHDLLPGGSCTPTMVHAGVKENAVADTCELFLDRRLLPGETAESEQSKIAARLDDVRRRYPDFSIDLDTVFAMEPAEIHGESPFVARVLEAAHAVTGERTELWGAPFGSDVSHLVNYGGIEAITFGPGDVAECHCPDERISVRELEDAAVAIAKVATELLVDHEEV